MRRLTAASIALAFGLPLAARAAPVTVERIVAVVNSNIILLSEAKERASQMGQPIDDKATDLAGKRAAELALKQIVERMVEDDLVLQQASELKLSVEDSEIDRAVDEVRKQNNLDESTFAQALASQGYTLASYRKDLRRQLLRLKVVNTAVRSRINVTDEDVRAFYDQTSRQAGGHRQAHVRHVLIAVPTGAETATVEQKRALASRVLTEARDGADFAELARKYSDDAASKADGGDLGTVKQGEGLPAALEEVIFSMDVKDVRGPVRTDRGFEVLQLLEKKDGDVKPFAEVKDQIKQQLYAQQLEKQTQAWLAELKKKAHVEERLQ
jgi:peptidyl-prolyl cis-trans isomerase SurA